MSIIDDGHLAGTPSRRQSASTGRILLSEGEASMVVAFRRHTLLLLDNRLCALRPSILHLMRSSLPSAAWHLATA
ncbi:hypothetical protein JQW73_21145 [Sulfitobacter pseudonitzschiae]|nr:hypothetical protein [Pseudosulfitobacter pseudonitzschiae]MBM1844285.1 hypothetical protein [Pseudosulfitobacter pseudonitzschiae]MBM1853980.1 hypothetical protein [Pseudosulfitobacter pseudonitzschiae]MBM1858834.1 hypothetical protein [Pseudosulfitobacter pseudonitzschiae]MBM1863691.1 hypothetical protein [Pseudosulfitobacter pseudonitzschiae]